MSQSLWKVTHYDHGSNALGEAFPEALHFDLYLDKIGDIQYDLDISSPLAVKANTRPYYTDYVLSRGIRNIQGGIHTGVNYADVSQGAVEVSGLDWLHYLEKCEWPFDPANPTANLYLQAGRDLALIVKDLFDIQFAQTNRLSIAYALVAIGQTTDYKIDVADSTNLFERVATLSKINPGFDFDISPDLTRTFKIYAPQKGSQRDLVFQQGSNVELSTYTNKGPAETHLLATATSSSGGQLASVIESTLQGIARRLDGDTQFDNVSSQAQLAGYAAGQSKRDEADQISFTVKYVPNENEDFWGEVNIGDQCLCYIPVGEGYDLINDYYRIVGISCDVTDEGEEDISITFDNASLPL